ncbi:MAG: SpoIIIAH-like family protein [Oscillospiraceae bacterium]|jgi:stage III sporulation protein AH|nr:SpoIIIAH-like family protein [Oscillospiraceae bacterium]
MAYFGKRQLVLAALVVALGTAVYLNWQFSANKDLVITDIESDSKELGEAQFVNNNVEGQNAEIEDADSESDDVQNQEVSTKPQEEGEGKNYFEQTKLKRKKTHEEATNAIKKILDSVTSSESAKTEAIKQGGEITKTIQQESNVESLLAAKGFEESIAFIHNDECTVVVEKGLLNKNSLLDIKDIVVGQGGIAIEKIKIIEAK